MYIEAIKRYMHGGCTHVCTGSRLQAPHGFTTYDATVRRPGRILDESTAFGMNQDYNAVSSTISL